MVRRYHAEKGWLTWLASQTKYVQYFDEAGWWYNALRAWSRDGQCTYTDVEGTTVIYNFQFEPFSIPVGATITGIEVLTQRAGDTDDYYEIGVEDKDAVTRWKTGTAHDGGETPCINATDEILGNPTDLWGGSWIPEHINSTGFQVSLRYRKAAKANEFHVDYLEVTVYYTGGAVGWRKLQFATEPPPKGQFTPLKFATEPPISGAWNKLLYENE
ncbi:MAG: hypothetical protein IBV52_01525 [Candidatus Bathyarchaeota archaeon]